MPRVIHWRFYEPSGDEVGMVACGLPNVNIWTHRNPVKINCPGCKQVRKAKAT